ncbi:MAG: hypothetical protein WHT27_06900 [candidate division WOR-3 bacterium]
MFENIVGHSKVKSILEKSILEKKVANAYLFTGNKGVGKFSLALEFAVQIFGEKYRKHVEEFKHPDLFIVYPFLKKDLISSDSILKSINEILQEGVKDKTTKKERTLFFLNFFSFSGNENIPVDLVREIIVESSTKPYLGEKRIFIVRNIEMMRKESANTFLKILEEPPKSTMFILTTDNLNGVLPTIVSRCQVLKFGYLTKDDFYKIYKELGYDEKKIENYLYIFDGYISPEIDLETTFDSQKSLNMFLSGDRDGFLKYFSTLSKKGEEKYFLKLFLKVLSKYLNEKILESENAKTAENLSEMLEELMSIEQDIRVNFQTAHIINHLFDLKEGVKDNVWKS